MTTTYRTPTRAELESSLEAHFRLAVRRTLGGQANKMAPTTKGMPDRLVLLPGGRMYLVELKTETGRVLPRQQVWHDRAAELGTEVVVLVGRAGVDEWVRARASEHDDQAHHGARSPEYQRGYSAGVRSKRRTRSTD